MKTNEFIKKIEALGYEIDNSMDDLIWVEKGEYNIASISKNDFFSIDTRLNGLKLIDSEIAQLIWEYASTPIEERKDENIYRLRHKWIGEIDVNYLNYREQKRHMFLSSAKPAKGYITEATISEWEKLTNQTWEQLLFQFNEIEVMIDNE